MSKSLNSVRGKVRKLMHKLYGLLSKYAAGCFKFLRTFMRTLKNKLFRVIFKEHYRQKLFRPSTTVAGYTVLYIIGVIALLINPHHIKQLLVSTQFEDHIIDVTIGFLTLLVPVAISLIEDSKINLIRPIIVKNIVRLKGLTIATSFTFFYTLLPIHGLYKDIISPLLVVSWAFFIFVFVRSYLWLTDIISGIHSDGSDKSFAGSSYRFARIVDALLSSKDQRTWEIVWRQENLPLDFEDQLTSYFFDKVRRELTGRIDVNKVELAGMELEIYFARIGKRNKDSWRLYNEHFQSVINIYSEVSKIMAEYSRTTIHPWRSQRSVLNIYKTLVGEGLRRKEGYSLIQVMNKYAESQGLLDSNKEDRSGSDELVSSFLNIAFDGTFQGEIDFHDLSDDLETSGRWLITYKDLYEESLGISGIILNTFIKWLSEKLNERHEEYYKIDDIIRVLFPEVDPITFSKLLWFYLQGKNNTDSTQILKQYYEKYPPFGGIGRVYGMYTVGGPDDTPEKKKAFFDTQRDAAIKLFSNVFAIYFKRMWNLTALIDESNKLISKNALPEAEMENLKSINQLLKSIDTYFSETTT